MPKFEWTKSDPVLQKAVILDGLGLNPVQVTSIAVQQQVSGYELEWHGKYYGNVGGNYVYIREDNAGGELPRLWLSGPKARTITNNKYLSSKVERDVQAIANNPNNITLLLAARKNITQRRLNPQTRRMG